MIRILQGALLAVGILQIFVLSTADASAAFLVPIIATAVGSTLVAEVIAAVGTFSAAILLNAVADEDSHDRCKRDQDERCSLSDL
jgi:hypothetical protein